MPWARIDDTLYDHPKLDLLGRNRLPCIGLWTVALSWSNRFLTDGMIPTDRVARLGGTRTQAEALCAAGLWECVEGGYYIHDFFAYSKSRDRVMREREGARDRQAKSRGSHDDVTPNSRVPRPVPVTRTRNNGSGSSTKGFPEGIGDILKRAAKP